VNTFLLVSKFRVGEGCCSVARGRGGRGGWSGGRGMKFLGTVRIPVQAWAAGEKRLRNIDLPQIVFVNGDVPSVNFCKYGAYL